MKLPTYLTLAQLARRFSMSQTWLQSAYENGEIEAAALIDGEGGDPRPLFDRDGVERFRSGKAKEYAELARTRKSSRAKRLAEAFK